MPIPLFKPTVHEEALAAAAEVMRSGWIGMGPRVAAFEKAFAEYLGLPDSQAAVAVNTCTSALHMAVRLLNLEKGSEVITTPNTFVATNQVLLWEGLKPVFADVDPATGNVTPESISAMISPRTRAIMVVHFAGLPCDLGAIAAIAHRYGVPVIEDSAHACGSQYQGKRVGTSGNLSAFSFGPTKALTTLDGGMLILPRGWLEKAHAFRMMGLSADIFRRLHNEVSGGRPSWDYDIEEPGRRYHMGDVNAALGLVHLKHLDAQNRRRAALAAQYDALLARVPGIRLIARPADRQSSHYMYVVLADRRDQLAAHLRARGITTSVHYKPSHLYPIFERCDLPGAEAFYARALALPLFPQMKDEDVETVAAAIREGW